ncbi:MAG: DUF433 domain-containing protein [Streptosporangiales bacterium]|nr:DUF433 domain-containing protein [Streptosporangiales bacterium]
MGIRVRSADARRAASQGHPCCHGGPSESSESSSGPLHRIGRRVRPCRVPEVGRSSATHPTRDRRAPAGARGGTCAGQQAPVHRRRRGAVRLRRARRGHPEGASARELVVVRHGQRVFAEIVEQYLRLVTFADDDYAERIQLPQYRSAKVVIDAEHAFGRPRFAHGGAKLEDVIDLLQAGEPLETVAAEFGLSQAEVEDALRVATRAAA